MSKISLKNKTILVTGAAGFIGSSLVKKLCENETSSIVIGIDNMNNYYDVSLKEYRLDRLNKFPNFIFFKEDIANKKIINKIFEQYNPACVINLAAQAGVRYSIVNPDSYIKSNIIGFYNIIEACRHSYEGANPGVEHFVYASSSSVYGANEKVPYSTDDQVDNPISLYAATKKANELIAHAYSKLYNIPSTGLRFFTVYGPAGRPDMAYYSFTNQLKQGKKIQIFNYGNCQRDFTFIDDIVQGVYLILKQSPDKLTGMDGLPIPPYKIYNIGNNHPEQLITLVDILQRELVRTGILPADYDFEKHKEFVPMQPGDVPVTYADISALEKDFGFRPSTSLSEGIKKFVEWYASYYG